MKEEQLSELKQWLETKPKHELVGFLVDVAWKNIHPNPNPKPEFFVKFQADNLTNGS